MADRPTWQDNVGHKLPKTVRLSLLTHLCKVGGNCSYSSFLRRFERLAGSVRVAAAASRCPLLFPVAVFCSAERLRLRMSIRLITFLDDGAGGVGRAGACAFFSRRSDTSEVRHRSSKYDASKSPVLVSMMCSAIPIISRGSLICGMS